MNPRNLSIQLGDASVSGYAFPADHDPYSPTRPKLGIRPRLAHFTWANYTLTMATGGLALLLRAQPFQFPGLFQIGLTVYIINIILFTLITCTQISRFFLFSGTFKASLTHRREGFFFPTFFLSIATLITSTQRYAIPDGLASEPSAALLWVIQAAFWAYVAITTAVAVGQYSYVFAAHSFGLQTMMPTWILPIFPIMLSGTIAAVIAGTQPSANAVPIIMAGLTCQGLGLAVATLMYAHMVGRLMQSGLPDREHRPGLFMCVGPPAFTALAFIGLAQALPADFDHDMDGLLDTNIIRTMAIIGAGFLWALSFWWFCIALLAVVQSPPRYFHLGWWAMVFPNTGFTLATISLGSAFQNDAVLWFGTAMSICLVLTYGFVLFHHVRAVIVQDIMYPGRDEDFDDH
ncbi:voltage-dependent anion channel [Cercophora scortea]|uniref:Voltage-dependent anion channel n=1 Tax=Cercophora scortea TaxID=314031 RepID=A0AAE0IV77_9PEZI|nr:voltage-dependent anion channel [Cercophora scortea]